MHLLLFIWTLTIVFVVQAQTPTPSPSTLSLNGTSGNSSLSCQICDHGLVKLPSKSIFVPGGGGLITCQTGEVFLHQATDEADCIERRKTLESVPLDLGAWCGCYGTHRPDKCPVLCSGGGRIVYANTAVQFMDIDLTCGEANLLVSYISDETFCDELGSVRTECCDGSPTESPTPKSNFTLSPTLSIAPSYSPVSEPPAPPSAASQYACSVCPAGSTMLDPDKKLYFLKNAPDVNCGMLEDFVARSATALECIKHISTVTEYPVSSAPFCGCSGVPPINLCLDFCPPGTDVLVPTQKISILGAAMTCEEAASLNPFVNNTDWCTAMHLDVAPRCCRPPGGPTLPPTPPPHPHYTLPPATVTAAETTGANTTSAASTWTAVMTIRGQSFQQHFVNTVWMSMFLAALL